MNSSHSAGAFPSSKYAVTAHNSRKSPFASQRLNNTTFHIPASIFILLLLFSTV